MFMHEMTVLTERGQTSIPANIRKKAKLKIGQKLHWQQVSDTEFKVTVLPPDDVPGPLAMVGYARKLRPHDLRSTSRWIKELREGEKE